LCCAIAAATALALLILTLLVGNAGHIGISNGDNGGGAVWQPGIAGAAGGGLNPQSQAVLSRGAIAPGGLGGGNAMGGREVQSSLDQAELTPTSVQVEWRRHPPGTRTPVPLAPTYQVVPGQGWSRG
jgi:hypothetical protein